MNITVVELDPEMVKISKKWFNLTLDKRHHLVMGDAIEYVKEAMQKGEKYDIILVDACSTRDALCPLEEVFNVEGAKMFSSILNDRGALIANVYAMTNDLTKLGNKVMTCTNHPRPQGLEEKYATFMKYSAAGAEAAPMVELL
ncbi:unnamed protein product [Strongylus vulgaris]|uniref:PABS domain-containing protein n=1 Tax=Strongylus vulgaris TaxID=40348 RepID=A0A3P7LPY2_STRVU|nr:unnamed protein product [Strongylus vulgaris]